MQLFYSVLSFVNPTLSSVYVSVSSCIPLCLQIFNIPWIVLLCDFTIRELVIFGEGLIIEHLVV